MGRKEDMAGQKEYRMARQRTAAIAGNPNVGKSTVFNHLTGMRQHTGNWPGKTVANATGFCNTDEYDYKMVDIPGTYSLLAHSAEEEVARDFICFGDADAVIVVCDATCLERNLNLVLQILEITTRVIVCVNLLDEAKKKGIHIHLDRLEKKLEVPVIGMVAREGKGMKALLAALDRMMREGGREADSAYGAGSRGYYIRYCGILEEAVSIVQPSVETILKEKCGKTSNLNARWLAVRLLDFDKTLEERICEYFQKDICQEADLKEALRKAKCLLAHNRYNKMRLEEEIVTSVMWEAESICDDSAVSAWERPDLKDREIDRILTSKRLGYPIMAVMLMAVLWLTITGANYPSRLLSEGLFWVQEKLSLFFWHIGAPDWLHDMLVLGVYRVLAWVVSVMLPPMAIFFPLFTLLEDVGYLPRIAYNLDKPFKKCCACGKQALTLCMGFGCNAVGVTGCRIIDSPRERLIAILTNSLVPCNGRFPPPYKGKQNCSPGTGNEETKPPYKVWQLYKHLFDDTIKLT